MSSRLRGLGGWLMGQQEARRSPTLRPAPMPYNPSVRGTVEWMVMPHLSDKETEAQGLR